MFFGKKIRQARKKAGVTGVDLGIKCGVSGPLISCYENDNIRPGSGAIVNIASALGDTTLLLDYLLTDPAYQAAKQDGLVDDVA